MVRYVTSRYTQAQAADGSLQRFICPAKKTLGFHNFHEHLTPDFAEEMTNLSAEKPIFMKIVANFHLVFVFLCAN